MRPYHNILPPTLQGEVFNAITNTRVEVVFLNLVDSAPLAKPIRNEFGSRVRIILLSHGLGCADILHEIRIRCVGSNRFKASNRDFRWLAGHLLAECDQRKYIDHVFCLSEFDVGLERWVGARSVSWLPRIIALQPLSWAPVSGRVGFVGTMDHPPNAEGLELFLKALQEIAQNSITIRLVGGPELRGAEFARRYSFVQYLGPQNDAQLETEAATWSCVIHPLFCWSRGCSTKLAGMLGWQIPLVTTTAGCRGYIWREGKIPQADTPGSFARLVWELARRPGGSSSRTDIIRVADTSPNLADVVNMARNHLSNLFP